MSHKERRMDKTGTKLFAAIIIAIVLLFGAGIAYIWGIASQYEEDHPYIGSVAEEAQKEQTWQQ